MLMDVRETKLDNGIRVITSQIPRVESVTLGIWVGVGGRYESAKLSGMSHFVEHMLFKGTRRRSPAQISRTIEGKGGYLNAFTQEESTCYYSKVPYDKIWVALDVLSDMYMNSVFEPAEIEKEKNVIIEEIMMYRDQPQHVVQDHLSSALWNRHALGRPIIGSPHSLEGITREDILKFTQKKYVCNNTVVSFAGRVDHHKCVNKVNSLMGNAVTGKKSSFAGAGDDTRQVDLICEERDIEQAHVAMGIRLFGCHDERRYALKVLSAVLGENMSSRLFLRIREKHGFAYSVHSGAHLYSDTGALLISAGLVRAKYQKALDLIIKELVKLKNTSISKAELTRAKDYSTGQLRLGMESTSQQMMRLGENILSHGRFISPESTIEKIESVSADDIQKLAQELLVSSRVSLAVVARNLSGKDNFRLREIIKALGE